MKRKCEIEEPRKKLKSTHTFDINGMSFNNFTTLPDEIKYDLFEVLVKSYTDLKEFQDTLLQKSLYNLKDMKYLSLD